MNTKKIILSCFFIIVIKSFASSQTYWPNGLTGRWTFDNQSSPELATVGNDLILVGFQIPIPGPAAGDNAVRLGRDSYYRCFHNIAANGSGSPSFVNKFTIMIDFRINQFGMWRSFYQTDPSNGSSNDAEAFINPSGNIGVGATGYSSYSLLAKEWYRLVITADLGNHYDYYLDGQLLQSGGAQTADGRFALFPSTNQNEVLLFADNDGEDNVMDIAQVAIFSRDLSSAEIDSLGGFGHNITTHQNGLNAYLQTPTPTSIYISWHSAQTSNTIVQYDTTSSLGLSATGSYENISTQQWHTVKLSGLIPDTHYYYRCISGTDTSQIYEFRTPFNQGTPGKHLRFVILGDSQNDINMPAIVSNAVEQKLLDLYGIYWKDSIAFVMRTGDMVQDGSAVTSYEDEYFSPFGNLTNSIPFMITIGNHEGENAYYYQYMKYEDFSDYAYPNQLTERYYSFSLGDCQFIAINSNSAFQTSTETTWLNNKLNQSNANPLVNFVFTYNHHPGHSEMWPDGNNNYVENSIYGELKNFPKVVLNSYGHSHNYERGVMKSTHGLPNDFRILCIGGAGAELDRWGMYTNQTDYEEINKAYDNYSYVIVDVNEDNKSYKASMYSLGNPDKRRYNELMDSWHYSSYQQAPDKPTAYSPSGNSSLAPTLVASPFNGIDSIMSSEFQLTAIPGNFTNPVIDSTRNWQDYYGDSGIPDFTPIDLNTVIDLKRLNVPAGKLLVGHLYGWRIRYRDQNVKWSEWSDEKTFFTTASIADSALFVADTTIGYSPLAVHFTDLSSNTPTTWSWDFDSDGNADSQLQDPLWIYTNDGLYTVSLTSHFGSDSSVTSKYHYIQVGNLVTISEASNNSDEIKVYPNPVKYQINIFLNSLEKRNINFNLYNNLNQLVLSRNLIVGENIIAVRHLQSGTYYYVLKENNALLKKDKLIILK